MNLLVNEKISLVGFDAGESGGSLIWIGSGFVGIKTLNTESEAFVMTSGLSELRAGELDWLFV